MSKEPHRGKEPTRVPFELPKPCGCESILWLYITLHGRDTPLNMRSLPSERAPTIQPFLIRFRFLTTITKACLEEHKRKTELNQVKYSEYAIIITGTNIPFCERWLFYYWMNVLMQWRTEDFPIITSSVDRSTSIVSYEATNSVTLNVSL